MIVLNDKRYALCKKELDETCYGYIRINKKSVSILNKNKQILANYSIHTVMGYYVLDDDGHYMFPDKPLFGKYLSYEDLYDNVLVVMKLIPDVQKYL